MVLARAPNHLPIPHLPLEGRRLVPLSGDRFPRAR
jgi:hypothetical protein